MDKEVKKDVLWDDSQKKKIITAIMLFIYKKLKIKAYLSNIFRSMAVLTIVSP